MQAGAPLEHVSASGETACVLAINIGATNALETLLAAGAHRKYRIHYAAVQGYAQVSMLHAKSMSVPSM